MATVKQGILTSAREWAKHLRPWGKRDFWKRERRAAHEVAWTDSCGCVFCDLGLPPQDGWHLSEIGEHIKCSRIGTE